MLDIGIGFRGRNRSFSLSVSNALINPESVRPNRRMGKTKRIEASSATAVNVFPNYQGDTISNTHFFIKNSALFKTESLRHKSLLAHIYCYTLSVFLAYTEFLTLSSTVPAQTLELLAFALIALTKF